MVYHIKDTEAVRVLNMAPGTCFILDGSLYMRTDQITHGAEVISAVHLETGHLMEILMDDIAIPLRILDITLVSREAADNRKDG